MVEFKIDVKDEEAKKLLEATLRVLKNVYGCDISYAEVQKVEEAKPIKTYDTWNQEKAEHIISRAKVNPIYVTDTNCGKRCYHFDYYENSVWAAGKEFDVINSEVLKNEWKQRES